MRTLLPTLSAAAVAAALAFAPAVTADAATHATSTSKHYTLSVAGNGKHATVSWVTLKVKKGTTPKPVAHTIPRAHEPWTKHVTAGADLYEIAAVQTTGSKLSCTIRNTHGKVLAHSTSTGRNTIVTCIVTKSSLLAGLGGGSGNGSGSGSGTSTGSVFSLLH